MVNFWTIVTGYDVYQGDFDTAQSENLQVELSSDFPTFVAEDECRLASRWMA